MKITERNKKVKKYLNIKCEECEVHTKKQIQAKSKDKLNRIHHTSIILKELERTNTCAYLHLW